ncbi:beta strand repeat-containing protein, partial [Campylobacter jejuni]|uniref:beta strand repeat-containing protein n=1 Tax=Campylobacter jejuni TaxID=197 RepID=UPI001001FDC8
MFTGGGIRKSHLNSKKIVLSLATISFLASCANAKLNSEIKTYDEANKNLKARPVASVYTPEARIDTTVSGSISNPINISDSGPHTIIIEAGGTLGSIGNNDRIIYAHANGSNTLTLTNLTNKGTINGNVNVEHDNDFKGTITVNTFENTGQVNGQIYMGVWGGNSGTLNIDKFNNSGTIKSNDGVFFEGKNTTINSFNNNGTINGNSSGIFVYGGNIQTLENSGAIISNGNYSNHAGIKLENGGSIENIINTGTIESNYSGIMVTYGKFGTLTIKDGGVIHGKYIGIGVGQWQTLGDLYIDGASSKKDGTASGVYGDSYGISLDVGSRTQKIELTNGGVIKGDISGIRLDSGASLSGEMILSGEGSRVEGGSDAGIFNFGGKIEGSIKVEDGATITATSSQAISNVGSGSITGGITVSGENTKLEGNIINADSASIGSDIKIENGAKVEGGLVNQGNGSISGSVQVSGGSTIDSITNEGNGAISGSITVDKDSKLDSITNTSTSDTGISGSITNNSDNKLEISNSGNIGGKIESTGAADMVISNNGGGTISGGISSSGSGNTSISNSQGSTINNGITVSGSAQVEISNQGSVGKDENGNTVTNNGSGSVG